MPEFSEMFSEIYGSFIYNLYGVFFLRESKKAYLAFMVAYTKRSWNVYMELWNSGILLYFMEFFFEVRELIPATFQKIPKLRNFRNCFSAFMEFL